MTTMATQTAPCGHADCRRSHRPGRTGRASHYALDKAERARQLSADGRLGGAKNGARGGRPRKRRAGAVMAELLSVSREEADAIIDGLNREEQVSLALVLWERASAERPRDAAAVVREFLGEHGRPR